MIKVGKKFIIILLVIIVVVFIFCLSYDLIIKEKEDDVIESKIWNLLSEESKEEEKAFLEAEKVMKKLIKDNKTMISDYKDIFNKNTDDKKELFSLVNTWKPALNFNGYRSGVGMSIYPLHFPPEDYYMFQQLIISLNDNEEVLEYSVFFTKDFKNIDMERYSLFIKGIFGISISSKTLKDAMMICLKEIDKVSKDDQFDYELYNNDGIIIKMVAMEDVTSQKYIAINAKYVP